MERSASPYAQSRFYEGRTFFFCVRRGSVILDTIRKKH